MVRGSPRKSYTLLGRYGEALKITNLSTQYDLEVELDGHFNYVYIALGASIGGFVNCIRPVLMVDVAHCKGKYKGVMLIAVSIDANMQVY